MQVGPIDTRARITLTQPCSLILLATNYREGLWLFNALSPLCMLELFHHHVVFVTINAPQWPRLMRALRSTSQLRRNTKQTMAVTGIHIASLDDYKNDSSSEIGALGLLLGESVLGSKKIHTQLKFLTAPAHSEAEAMQFLRT